MRQLTGLERDVLRAKDYRVFGRLAFKGRADESFRLVDDFLAYNPLYSAQWGQSVDDAVAKGTIVVKSGRGYRNLSPYANGFSGIGLLGAGTFIDLQTACVSPAMGRSYPDEGDWKSVFTGRVDSADPAGNRDTLVLKCRDLGCEWQDTWLEEPASMEPQTLNELLVAMRDVAASYYPAMLDSLSPLVVIGTTYGDTVPGYVIDKESLWDAAIKQVRAYGADLRFKYHTTGIYTGNEDFGPVLYRPERGGIPDVPHAIIGADEYLRIASLPIDRSTVRNVVSVIPFDGSRIAQVAVNEESIARHGRHFMEISENKTSQIDTAAKALALAAVCVLDLKDPQAAGNMEMRYWWPVEVNDWHLYGPDGQVTEVELPFGVYSYEHQLTWGENPSDRTSLAFRGNPSAANRAWRRNNTPKMQYVATTEPVGIAYEGARWAQVASLDIPMALHRRTQRRLAAARTLPLAMRPTVVRRDTPRPVARR